MQDTFCPVFARCFASCCCSLTLPPPSQSHSPALSLPPSHHPPSPIGAMTFHEKHLDALVAFFGSWVPLADKTVYLTVPGMDKALAPLGETLGFEIGMLKVGK